MGNLVALQAVPGSIAGSDSSAVDGSGALFPLSTDELVSLATAPKANRPEADLSSFGALVEQASAGPEVRLERVAALQQAIAAGTYRILAEAVAEKMIDSFVVDDSPMVDVQ